MKKEISMGNLSKNTKQKKGKNIMKKSFIALALAVTCIFTLTACSDVIASQTIERNLVGTFDGDICIDGTIYPEKFPTADEIEFVSDQELLANEDVTIQWGEHIEGATQLHTSVVTDIKDFTVKANCPYTIITIDEDVTKITLNIADESIKNVKFLLENGGDVISVSSYEEKIEASFDSNVVVLLAHDGTKSLVFATVTVPEGTTPTFKCTQPLEYSILKDNTYQCRISIDENYNGVGGLLITGEGIDTTEIPFEF